MTVESIVWAKGKPAWAATETTRVGELNAGPVAKTRPVYYFTANGKEYWGVGKAHKSQPVYFDQQRPSRNSLVKNVTLRERCSLFISLTLALILIYVATSLLESG